MLEDVFANGNNICQIVHSPQVCVMFIPLGRLLLRIAP